MSGRFHRWYWAFVPMLAIIAYASVLRIGFLGDDSALILQAQDLGWNVSALMPRHEWFFYRPVGTLLTWKLGYQLWGYNPFPLHLQGLLLHAGVALALGLWVAEVTSRRSLGWLAGALFAMFPLHLEAVGWLAAQWDLWAAFFGITSLWLFVLWLRRRRSWLYLLSLLLYTFGVFSKESLLVFLPMFVLSAWLVLPRQDRAGWGRVALGLVPFCLALALNVGLRLSTWGNLGGYGGAPVDWASFVWDGFIRYSHLLLAPINPTIFGNPVAQMTGLITTGLLLAGLIRYGSAHSRILAVALVWVLLMLVPVLNLPVESGDLESNRFLYLPAAGYCVVVAILLHSAVLSIRQGRLAVAVVGLLVFISIIICWVQLRPWHTATVQAEALEQDLHEIIPVQPRPNGIVWYLQNAPDNYQGAYLFRLGMGELRSVMYGEWAAIQQVDNASRVDLTAESRDVYALRFGYKPTTNRFYVDYAAGITWGSHPPPTNAAPGSGLSVWDFTRCASDVVNAWQVRNAQSTCQAGEGLVLRPTSGDSQFVSPDVTVDPHADGASFVRLRVSVRYPRGPQDQGRVNQWFWKGPGEDLSAEHSKASPVKSDGHFHVYWTYIPTAELGGVISSLRFDPVNDATSSTISWIAVDKVLPIPDP